MDHLPSKARFKYLEFKNALLELDIAVNDFTNPKKEIPRSAPSVMNPERDPGTASPGREQSDTTKSKSGFPQ